MENHIRETKFIFRIVWYVGICEVPFWSILIYPQVSIDWSHETQFVYIIFKMFFKHTYWMKLGSINFQRILVLWPKWARLFWIGNQIIIKWVKN